MLRSLSSVRRDVLSSDPVGFSDVLELYLVGESRYINSLLKLRAVGAKTNVTIQKQAEQPRKI